MKITYVRHGELPQCKTCEKRMKYWVPGLADSEHEHPKCAGRRLARSFIEAIKAITI